MAISILGTYSATATKTTGAKTSPTDLANVTIPSGATTAIISEHFWDNNGATVGPGAPTLDGQLGVEIVSYRTNGGNNSVRAWRVSGFSTGSGKILSWSNSNNIASGVGFRISFFSGEDTASPIRDFEASAVSGSGGNVDFSGLDFQAGDLTIICTSSDNSGVLLDGGANTVLVTEAASDGIQSGQAYRTDGGAIGTPSSSNSFLGAVALVLKAASGGSNDTLTAATGSFTETGVAVSFHASMAAAAGSFAETGIAATLSPKIAIAAGSFTETGVAATFGASIPAAAGSFAHTGQAALFEATGQDSVSMTADPVAFALSGQAAALPTRMAVAAGAFTHTGVAAILSPKLTAAAGSFLEIGVAAALVPGYQGGMVPLQWNSVGGATGYIVRWGSIQGGPYPNEIDVGNVTSHILAGISSGRWYLVVYSYDGGGESVASNELVADVVGTNNTNLVAAVGTFTHTGQAAVLRPALVAAGGAFTETGVATTLRIGMTSAVGPRTLTGVASILRPAVVVEHGEYVLTGQGTLQHVGLVASVSPYNLVGPVVNLFASEVGRIPAETGALTVGGQNVALTQHIVLTHGVYAVTGVDVAAAIGVALEAGAYEWNGVDASMGIGLRAERGVFSLTGASIGVEARFRVTLLPKLMQRRY